MLYYHKDINRVAGVRSLAPRVQMMVEQNLLDGNVAELWETDDKVSFSFLCFSAGSMV